ncbi:MAG: bifunctional diaminohydroxyphosphoribosylaminopyrimidine deaminase/5-amino-6-(5-phosphoribosylamino)uracil reductase RibD [Candidatus Omnitrophica bacterium]|nr:bifunctional diaminohydroxyphosphoribosylaminopyrimidine deaminase/5-amino-6-(5-phosphoribosylamino)uracil reductase RibD [Candidatus Omnitrophota bacterium]
MTDLSQDEQWMRMALRLAARGRLTTRPNPMVGAVVVRSGRIVGSGFHRAAGKPHAEILALRQAGASAVGATLYVSLEPCAHTGRTPPCAEAIAAAGIRRVVAAMIDPNPKTNGRGLRWLRGHGIRTKVGILGEEAKRLNEVFITWIRKRRPFVTVKVAQSLDGKIATRTGESRWISGLEARAWVHRLRAQVDAVLIGVETVLKDDPLLTVHSAKGNNPIRVVLDSHLRTLANARLFSSCSPVLIAAARGASYQKEKKLRQAGAEILRLPARDGRVDLQALLRQLARREISHLLIEGGGETIASAFAARAVDRVCWIVAPLVVGGRQAPTAVEGMGVSSLNQAVRLKDLSVQHLGPDLLLQGYVHWNR